MMIEAEADAGAREIAERGILLFALTDELASAAEIAEKLHLLIAPHEDVAVAATDAELTDLRRVSLVLTAA